MFDISKRKYISQPTVRDLISILEGENLDAIVTVDGLDEFYIHCTEDGHHLGIDLSDLDEDYAADFESKGLEYPEEYYDRTPFKVDNGMSRMECYDLLSRVVDNVSEPFLIEHGFTKNQIKEIKGE